MVYIMSDFYFTENGDIRIAPNGDIALTETTYRNLGQQAHIRTMTDIGDYVLYPRLGADLTQLFGMPQSQKTGEFGAKLIESALARENVFAGETIRVKSVPTGPQTIRFDVFIVTRTGNNLVLSIERNLSTQE